MKPLPAPENAPVVVPAPNEQLLGAVVVVTLPLLAVRAAARRGGRPTSNGLTASRPLYSSDPDVHVRRAPY